MNHAVSISPTIKALLDRWPSAIVARSEVRTFSGGAISPGYLANLDSAGAGPPGAFRLGSKVCYPVDRLAEWLESRAQPIERRRRRGEDEL
jgi:hypothetical protein